jgi:hypothetical protein
MTDRSQRRSLGFGAHREREDGQFLSIPDADHGATTWRAEEILAHALPFLTTATQ